MRATMPEVDDVNENREKRGRRNQKMKINMISTFSLYIALVVVKK